MPGAFPGLELLPGHPGKGQGMGTPTLNLCWALPGLCPCDKVWHGLGAVGTPSNPTGAAPGKAGTPHLNRQSPDGFRDTGATPCSKQFPFPCLSPPRPNGVTCATRGGFGKATVPSLQKQHNSQKTLPRFTFPSYFISLFLENSSIVPQI